MCKVYLIIMKLSIIVHSCAHASKIKHFFCDAQFISSLMHADVISITIAYAADTCIVLSNLGQHIQLGMKIWVK